MNQNDMDSLFTRPVPPVDPSGLIAAPDGADAFDDEIPARPRGPWLGVGALALVGIVAIIDGIAISVAYDDDYDTAIALAIVAIAIATASFGLGLAAVITRRGRAWGVAAMVLSVVANPYLLAGMLGIASGMFGA